MLPLNLLYVKVLILTHGALKVSYNIRWTPLFSRSLKYIRWGRLKIKKPSTEILAKVQVDGSKTPAREAEDPFLYCISCPKSIFCIQGENKGHLPCFVVAK